MSNVGTTVHSIMFIIIVGTPCSGKTSVLDYFIAKGFTHLILQSNINVAGSKRDSTLPELDSILDRANVAAEGKRLKKFSSPSHMLDYATRNWQSNFATTSLTDSSLLRDFLIRPFVLVLRVEAPLLLRWRRTKQKHPSRAPSLEEFVQINDEIMFTPSAVPVQSSTEELVVSNVFASLDLLHDQLDSLDLTHPERLRPGWDTYFMTLAQLASLRSNCMKRRVGAILVRNKRILATGYNGTPRHLTNCNEGGCARCNNGGNVASGDECLCLHAEENALLEAGRERVGDDAVLYCNTCPCLRCSIKIVQTGVGEVVYNMGYKMDDATARVFSEAGVLLRQHSPPA